MPLTDAEHAAQVRAAVAELNRVLAAAMDAGLTARLEDLVLRTMKGSRDLVSVSVSRPL